MKIKCPCCNNDNFFEKYNDIAGEDGKFYSIIQCDFCKFSTLSPMPTDKELTQFYTQKYNGKTKTNILEFKNPEDFIKTNKSVYEDMSNRLLDIEKIANISNNQKRLSLLDVGCSYGHMVYVAGRRGYLSKGVDLDTESVSYGVTKLGLPLKVGTIYDVKSKFDIITQWMSLEHVLDPNNQVSEVYNCLNDNGIYAGSVPNMGGYYAKLKGRKWYNIVPPEHVNYFNNDNLRMMLKDKGFDVLFAGAIARYAAPSINFGIRKKLNKTISKIENNLLKALLLIFYRFLTVIKRIFVYRLLNFIIIKFKLGGNGIFWVARKSKNK